MNIKLVGKECDKLINKIIKMINGINKYNIESAIIMQIITIDDKIEPIFISKPMNVDIYEYMKKIFSDNDVYNMNLNHIRYFKEKGILKHRKDASYYSPIIFSILSDYPLYKLEKEDILLDPSYMCYNGNIEISNTYFIIPEIFKDFVSKYKIYGIDNEFNLYENEYTRYDTSSFLFEIKINDKFKIDFVKHNSPERVLPFNIEGKNNDVFINSIIKDIFVKLNSAISNKDFYELLDKSFDIGFYKDTDEEYIEFREKLKILGTISFKNKTNTINNLFFNEFFKINPKILLFLNKTIEKEKIKEIYSGILLKTKDYSLYIFYKYFDINNI